MKIAIDGSPTGGYRADCECGTSWSGTTFRDRSTYFSPALPVAEAVVHMRMCHDNVGLQLCFTWRFENWLEKYWELSSNTANLLTASTVR